MNDEEKERWKLIGLIFTAVGGAIATFFGSK